MSSNASPAAPAGQLNSKAMGTAGILLFVLAGVAPLAAMASVVALAVAFGNGAGVPGTYLIAALVLSLFASGYIQMSRRVTDVGGFYSYARRGLGTAAGGATAYVAVVAYNAATIGIAGAAAYFARLAGQSMHIDLPWQYWALGMFAIVAALSYFKVTMSAVVLGVALAAEVLILLVFDAAVLIHNGFHGFSLDVFKPSVVLGSGFGISLMFCLGAFVGFEATALYGEEARNPRRSVPRATYLALAVISIFYLFTSWAAVSAYGVHQVKAAAAHDLGGFLFTANTQYVGGSATSLMELLLVSSAFATYLAFHCNTARYLYALGRDGLLPRALSRTRPANGAPVIASAVQLTLTAAVLIATSVTGLDPYLGLAVSVYGVATMGIVVLQAIASLSFVGFFLRHRQGESVWWALVAPALAAAALAATLVLIVQHYSLLANGSVHQLIYLPFLLPVAAIAGAVVATRRARALAVATSSAVGGRPAAVTTEA